MTEKIAVYGTGNLAKETISILRERRIEPLAVYDRVHLGGMFCGIPILEWDKVGKSGVSEVIIAAPQQYIEEIYKRLFPKAKKYNIRITDCRGENLNDLFGRPDYKMELTEYRKKSLTDLCEEIDRVEAVSFDVFDTLVMRKILEPADVFDIVSNRIKKQGIEIKNFKAFRREAELEANGGNIYEIYRILKNKYGELLSDIKPVLEEELKCEKQIIVARNDMKEVLNYAVGHGKKVSLISDMYFPENIIRELLKNCGIHGDFKIYVSCDYGMGKGNGLFEVYKENTGAESYLHIGDNIYSDVYPAMNNGINTYHIKSAYDIALMTSISKIISLADEVAEKRALGIILEKMFNSPFLTDFLEDEILYEDGISLEGNYER